MSRDGVEVNDTLSPDGLEKFCPVGLFAAFVVLLQFIVLTPLADISQMGKGFSAVLVAFIASGMLLSRRKMLLYPLISPLIFGLMGWLLLSALNAKLPAESLVGVAFLGIGLLFTLLVVNLLNKEENFVRHLLNALLLGGVIAACLGLFEYLRYRLFSRTADLLIPYLLPPDNNPRVDGMFGQPNLFALFLVLVLIAFFMRYLHRVQPVSRDRIGGRFIPVFLIALVLVLTGSRSGLLAFFLTFSLLSWLVVRGRYLSGDRQGRRELLLLLVTVALGMVFGLLWDRGFLSIAGAGGSGGATAQFQGVSGFSTDTRFLFWTSAGLIFADHPLLGIGLDNYQALVVPYRLKAYNLLGFIDHESFSYSKWAHNEPLQMLCEGGAPTALLLLTLLVLLVWYFCAGIKSGRANRSPLFLYSHLFLLPFLLQCLLSWPLRHASLLILFFVFLGLVLSQYSRKELVLTRWRKRTAFFLLLAGLAIAGTLLFQEVRLGNFFHNYVKGSGTIGISSLTEAVASPFTELRGLRLAIPDLTRMAIKDDNPDLAKALIPFAERLVRLQSHEDHLINLALLYFYVGEFARADGVIQESIDLNPGNGLAWAVQHYLNIHQVARKTGRPVEEYYPGTAAQYQILELFHD